MAEEKNIQKLSDDSLENVGGGFAGRDPYTTAEYNKFRVTHEHNILSKDKYFFYGNQISQDEAETIVKAGRIKEKYGIKNK